jgi:hypothetical protein
MHKPIDDRMERPFGVILRGRSYIPAFHPYIARTFPRTSDDPLARHLFYIGQDVSLSIGQDVSLHSQIFVPASSQGAHRIIAILPDGGEEPRYLMQIRRRADDTRHQPA